MADDASAHPDVLNQAAQGQLKSIIERIERLEQEKTEIVTPRLRLRRAQAGDLAALHAVFSHPVAMRYWSRPPHTELDRLLRDKG